MCVTVTVTVTVTITFTITIITTVACYPSRDCVHVPDPALTVHTALTPRPYMASLVFCVWRRYLLLNTAISYTWGFPQPCPEGCACDCYDCRKPECACAVPAGMCDNFPASFEVRR
jgi:hypothetical protein